MATAIRRSATPIPPGRRSVWLARMVERHCWFRTLLHAALVLRRPRNVRWHLACIWREVARKSSPNPER